ncbi:MAG: hypothetical protein K6G28_06205 [Acholeplasmatales bacterium]|nr:hypothetical protein [Acholeplasmatales bacterium]
MLYLEKSKIEEIDSLMYNKALDTDVAMYNLIFDNSDTTFAKTSLYLYVNEDGGFGHGLNPDNISPISTTFETYEALKFLREAGIRSINEDETTQELIGGAFKFLSKKMKYSVRERINDKYACALYLKGDDDDSLRVGIIGQTLYFLPKENKYYKRALEDLNKIYDSLLANNSTDYFYLEQLKGLIFSLIIKDELKDKQDSLLAKFNVLLHKYLEQSDIERDCFEILYLLEDFDLTEDEQYYFDKALDALVNIRAHHGMWENNHKWGNEDMYPEAMSAELKWLGRQTRYAMHYLVKYNRIK